MSNIAFPTLSVLRDSPPSLKWELVSNTQVFTSELSGSMQTLELPGARWSCEVPWADLEEDDAALLQAFLAKLRGQANRALIYNWARSVPRGTINVSGVTIDSLVSPLAGPVAGATTVTFKGCGASKTLVTGDFFSIGTELKLVVDGPYVAGVGGQMVNVAFEPPVRAAWSYGDPVVLTKPTCKMILSDPRGTWTTRPGKFTDVPMQFIEMF